MKVLVKALIAVLICTQAGVVSVIAAGNVSPKQTGTQLAAARRQMAETKAAIDKAERRIDYDDQQLAAGQAESEQLRIHVASLARLIYVSDNRPALLMIFQAPSLSVGVQKALDAQAVNADARRDTARLRDLAWQADDLRRDRSEAMTQAAQLSTQLDLQLTQVEGLDVWAKVRLWDQANHLSFKGRDQLIQAQSFAWPLPTGRLSQGYGPTNLRFEPPFAGFSHFHTGFDIAAPYGSAVISASDGVVIGIGSDSYGYGNYAVIGHPDGSAALYAHLSALSVAPGQMISRGQRVGAEGSSGNSTGPHLHFEVLVDGQAVDPGPFLALP